MQMIDKNKESQNQSLAELQQELKSLKALLLSRGPRGPTVPSVPASPMPLLGRPTIPAWQLVNLPNVDSLSTVSDSAINSLPPSVQLVNENGKELDTISS
jgi:peroxin-14